MVPAMRKWKLIMDFKKWFRFVTNKLFCWSGRIWRAGESAASIRMIAFNWIHFERQNNPSKSFRSARNRAHHGTSLVNMNNQLLILLKGILRWLPRSDPLFGIKTNVTGYLPSCTLMTGKTVQMIAISFGFHHQFKTWDIFSACRTDSRDAE